MKKKIIGVITVIIICMTTLCACGSSSSDKDNTNKIDLGNQEIAFNNFTIYMKSAEQDGNSITIDLEWRNDSFTSETTFLGAVAGVDAMQGEVSLQNISEGYSDPKNGDVYFPNAVGGRTSVQLKYTLADNTTPVSLSFVPIDDESSKIFTINLL